MYLDEEQNLCGGFSLDPQMHRDLAELPYKGEDSKTTPVWPPSLLVFKLSNQVKLSLEKKDHKII